MHTHWHTHTYTTYMHRTYRHGQKTANGLLIGQLLNIGFVLSSLILLGKTCQSHCSLLPQCWVKTVIAQCFKRWPSCKLHNVKPCLYGGREECAKLKASQQWSLPTELQGETPHRRKWLYYHRAMLLLREPQLRWMSVLFAYSYVLNLCTLEITLSFSVDRYALSLCVGIVCVPFPTSFPLKFEYGLKFIKWCMWNSTWIWAMVLWDVFLSWWWIILHLRQEEKWRRKGRGRERRVKKRMWRRS